MERILERIASRQHGVVTRAEALAAGVTADEIHHRLRSGALLRVYRGVHRLGHKAPSSRARYMAAVKACGEGAALSGLAAAHLLGLLRFAPSRLEVTAPTERRVRGVWVHRARRGAIERTNHHGIPVTTLARTLVDIAARLDDETLGRACHEAFVHHKCTPAQVKTVLSRRPNAAGGRRLLRIISGEDPLFLSRLERRFFQILREEGLELPVTNTRVDNRYIDCRWPHLRLTIELDSYRFHGSRMAWERDRQRDREARRRGDEMLRYTSVDVFDDTAPMRAELRARIPLARATSASA